MEGREEEEEEGRGQLCPAGSEGEEGEREGGEGEGEGVDWRERCLLLEESLHRFRQQAGKIRHTLGQKGLQT
ncbi:hypothetical protein ACOMHN_012776 [Nucella lapillus]